MDITADQVRNLWHNGGTIDRGDEYDVLRQADVFALVENGDVDTEDDGTPTEEMWQVLADALSFADTDHPRERALIAIEDAAARLANAEGERDDAIRKALTEGASVIAIASAAGLSRARIYQIRDRRR